MIHPMNMEGRQQKPMGIKMRGKRPRSKKRYALVVLLFLVVAGSVLSAIGYGIYSIGYHADASLAQTSIRHLQKAESLLLALPQKPIDDHLVSQIQQEFTSALTGSVQLDNDLKSVPGAAMFIPVYGTRLSAALHLASLAIGISQAGVAGCKILSVLLMKHTSQQELTAEDMIGINPDFRQVKAGLRQAIGEANQVQPSDLQFDPHVSKLFATFRKEVPTIQTWLGALDKLSPVLPTLLGIGTPTNYLIEVLDSTELRPAGGFIGNYGFATFSGGRLTDAHITDVDLLDRPFEAAGHTIPFPAQYRWFGSALRLDNWSFRDSNLDADFPTAARNGELTYTQEGGNVPVQGVIAITPAFIQHVFAITGPIDVPEYGETVTAQNLIDRIHYHQLGPAGEGSDRIPSPDGHSSLRKHFTALLAKHLLARVQQLSSSASSPKLLHTVISAVRSKDIQMYFNADNAENLLHVLHLDGAIQSPVGDSLFIVDANVSGNKASSLISNTVTDQITLDEKGNAIHHTTMSYAWTIAGQNYGSNIYHDYVRVYVPSGSILQDQEGWQPQRESSTFDRQVWAGLFTLPYGQTHTITLAWTVPGAAKKDLQGWHYQYLVQRQAGIQRKQDLTIEFPSCATVTSKSSGLLPSDKHKVKLAQLLTEDLSVRADYVCK